MLTRSLGALISTPPPWAQGPLPVEDRFLPALVVGLLALGVLGGMVVYIRRLERSQSRLFSDLRNELAERHRAEQALRESEVFYHSLVETLPQSILRKDLGGQFTFVNQRFCNELGRPYEEIVGKTDLDFFPRELAEKYRADDRRVIETGQVLDTVEKHVTPQGATLYVQVIKTPLFGPDGKVIGMQGIFWDVTARKRAEEQLQAQNVMLQEMAASEHAAHQALKAAQSHLVQSEKLVSLGHMVAGVAHEINNPLSFVGNNLAVLERDFRELHELIGLYERAHELLAKADPALWEEVQCRRQELDVDYTLESLPKLLERTREGLRRIQRIVSDLRVFARIDQGELVEVDLNPGIESTVNIIQGNAKRKGVQIQLDLVPLPPVRCYAARINQVIMNLLSNAIDACEQGGKVCVRSFTDDQGVVIEVSDSGCGIPAEVRERIFDPFFTTKPIGQGTGLGLSISYGIVQDHGGVIRVDSAPGRGTKFQVCLPLAPQLAKR